MEIEVETEVGGGGRDRDRGRGVEVETEIEVGAEVGEGRERSKGSVREEIEGWKAEVEIGVQKVDKTWGNGKQMSVERRSQGK